MTSSKLLKIIFGILIVIIIGELVFILRYNFTQTKNNTNYVNANSVPLFKKYPNLNNNLSKILVNLNSKNDNLYLVSNISGQVVEIDKTGRKSFNPKILKWGIKIKNQDYPEGEWLYYTNLGLPRMKVFLNKGEVLIKANHNDIEINDRVVIQEFSNIKDLNQDIRQKEKIVLEIYRDNNE